VVVWGTWGRSTLAVSALADRYSAAISYFVVCGGSGGGCRDEACVREAAFSGVRRGSAHAKGVTGDHGSDVRYHKVDASEVLEARFGGGGRGWLRI